MHEDKSPTTSPGLKRKLFPTADNSTLRESLQLSKTLKALARRRISTNKEFDIIREQQQQEEKCGSTAPCEAGKCDRLQSLDDHDLPVIWPEYSSFTALTHLLDDALDEVLNLSPEKLRLISVDLDLREGKIIIFNTGKGLEAASISSWGALGTPKLEPNGRDHSPNQGNAGINYGVISAGFSLGRSMTVSSRTKASNVVAVIHLERRTWEEGARATQRRKIPGDARIPTEEEENNSPHGSFTKVEIAELKLEVMQWDVAELRRKLKDFFFPLIQGECGSSSIGSFTNPITIMAMGLNLATIKGGRMAIMKSLFSDREPFVVHLHLIECAGGSKANATITIHYFPLTRGRETMDFLQERLKEDRPEHIQEDDNTDDYSRVTVRWRGRLLLKENWKPFPFMESCKDHTLVEQECYNRVLVFVDTDNGFLTTPSKMSLAADHCFTKALTSCGIQQKNDTTTRVRVDITIQGQEWPLTPQLLGEEYYNWILNCNRLYDTEEPRTRNIKDIRQTCVTKPHNKLEMGITRPVFQVAWNLKIQGIELNARDPDRGPIRLKLVKQSGPQLFFTLECFICVGPLKASGTTYIICRPIYVPEEKGSTIDVGPDPTFYLKESKAFPLDETFLKKFHEVDEITWSGYEDKLYGNNPAFVELLNEEEMHEFGVNGVLPRNSSVEAGYKLPGEFLAVIRPRSCARASCLSGVLCRTDQKTIVSEPMEVLLEVRFINEYISEDVVLTEEQVITSRTVYKCTTKACARKGVQSIYSFITDGTDFHTLFTTMGTYLLAFSLVSEKYKNVAPAVARINVTACEEVENWQLCSHLGACSKHPSLCKIQSLESRIGEVLADPLFLCGFDVYNNLVAFSNVPEELHLELGQPDGELLELCVTIPRDRISLTPDNSALQLKGIEIGCGSLAQLAPAYVAHLWILIHNFPMASYQLTVFPGEPASVALTECDRLDNCLRPGQTIEKFVLQAFDDYKNVVEKGREIRVNVEGLQLLEKRSPVSQVGEQGCVHLGGLLKVTAEYNSKGTIAILSDKGKSLLTLDFHTVYRSLRILKEPEEACAGSQLEDLEVQVIDEDGNVDSRMDGFSHSLTLDWKPGLSLPLTCGTCTLPAIQLPAVPGTWHGRVAHANHPELFFILEVAVVSKLSSELNLIPAESLDSPPNHLQVLSPPQLHPLWNVKNLIPAESLESPPLQVSSPPELHSIWNVKKEIGEKSETSALREEYERQLKDFIDRNTKLQRKLREQGRKVKQAEDELAILKRTRKEVDDMEAVWKEELKAFESAAKANEGQRSARAMNSSPTKTNTSPQVIEVLKKQGDPPGTHAASILLEAVVKDSAVFDEGGAGSDILGIVALLASVDNDQLNRSDEGLKYLRRTDTTGKEGDESTLHGFARSRNRAVTGRFRVLILDEASFYNRQDGLPSVDDEHPQKLLRMPDPGPKDEPLPKGFLGYAVNLLRFNPQQLECYATPAKHSLRESLFFQLFSYLQVYDTMEHMSYAQKYLTTGGVSLDGGLIHGKSSLEHVLGEEPGVKFPVLQTEKSDNHQQNLILPSSSNLSQEKKLIVNMVQFELAQKIKTLHEETGYTQLTMQIKKMETKLIRARSKISVMVKEVKREEDRKAEILRRITELRD